MIALTAIDDFWNVFLYGSGSWLYIVLLLGIIFLIDLRFRYFAIIGVTVCIFSILNIVTYADSTIWTLDLVYKTLLFSMGIFLNAMLGSGVIHEN